MDAAGRRLEFVRFALAHQVLKFGEFTVKSGRISPYFFNAGLFHSGRSVGQLADFYAQTLMASGVSFDMLYGPAYKGIPLAAATAISLSKATIADRDVPFAFNRKEVKAHGEGGHLIGAPLRGRVIIIDDVITAGTSVRESITLIRAEGAEPAGVLIALDRMEVAGSKEAPASHSAVEAVEQQYGIPVISIASLDDIMQLLQETPDLAAYQDAVADYRQRYGTR